MPTIADHDGAAHALVAATARALDVDPARLHPTSRLDRGVSGVVVFALTKAAAERLARARTEGTYERRYLAIAARAPEPSRGTWDAPLGRAKDARLRMVGGRDPIAASTRFGVCAVAPGGAALLAVSPVTGRTHQIRVHAAWCGHPVLGDEKYGDEAANAEFAALGLRRMFLHAHSLAFSWPGGGAQSFIAPLPPELRAVLERLSEKR
jgi:23S rRNA pseudouridine955/2504/2580 synthase